MTMAYVAAAIALVGVGVSARSAQVQGQTAKKVAKYNAQMNEYTAQDAIKRGSEHAAAIQRRGAAIKSSQRAALGARGLDLSYGTAADLQDQTDFFTQGDVATARDNAARDAWSARAQGGLSLAQGRAAQQQGNLQAAGTLISGSGQVAERWYAATRKPATTPPPAGG